MLCHRTTQHDAEGKSISKETHWLLIISQQSAPHLKTIILKSYLADEVFPLTPVPLLNG